MRRWGALLALFVCAACGLFPDLAGLVDGGSIDAPDHGFTLDAAPTFVAMDPGDAPVAVNITATRAAGFADAIALAVSGGVGTISTPAPIGQGNVSSSLTISIDPSTTARGDFTFAITGSSGAFTGQTTFILHIGSLLAPDDAGVVVVPQGAHAIVVKAWGAGGGCGSYGATGSCASGASFGGGGGYASAIFDLVGGTSFVVVPATGGASSNVSFAGGAGGGFSGVRAGADWILIAGGGGGGGGAFATGNGGSGGGNIGHAGSGKCAGSGGTETSGGAGECSDASVLGTALRGGDGQDEKTTPASIGGLPGGGAGGTGGFGSGAGGGGGGWFGGGGGTIYDCEDNSGGGGSGHVSDAGRDATFVTTDAATPIAANDTDTDYASGSAIGCNVFSKKGTGGSPGRVVVRLVKP